MTAAIDLASLTSEEAATLRELRRLATRLDRRTPAWTVAQADRDQMQLPGFVPPSAVVTTDSDTYPTDDRARAAVARILAALAPHLEVTR